MAPPKGFIPWNKGKKGIPWTEEQRKKASMSHMGNPSNTGRKLPPDHCENISKGLLGIKRTPEFKENLSKKLKGRVFTPEWKEKISDSLKGKFLGVKKGPMPEATKQKLRERTFSDETRAKMSAAKKGKPSPFKGIPKSEEHKQKLRAAMLGKNSGKDSYLWKGGTSFEPYCVKFSRKFKERVRYFFGNTCVECGAPPNGKKLIVHHVNFDKMSCCNDTIPLFVPLCNSCHAKTNFNREYWEDHFTDLINKKYGGKCYFSDEELTEYLLSAQ